MKLKDFLKLFEGKNPEKEIVVSDLHGNFTKSVEVSEAFVPYLEFSHDPFSVKLNINNAIEKGHDPVEVLLIW